MECEEHKRYVKFLNENLFKNEELKGQPWDVIKLHEKIETLKSILTKFVSGIQNLEKLLRNNKCPLDRSGNGYEGNIYVHDEDTIVCYFCGKVGHMTFKCKDQLRIGLSNAFKANTKWPKKIWVLEKKRQILL